MRLQGVLASLMLLAACAGGPEVHTPAPAPDPGPAAPAPGPVPTPAPAPLPAAPWSAARLPADAVPAVYHTEWRAAPNRGNCALIAPATAGRPDATPRGATFAGGWAVAYDIPDLRSAFGVAGTGTTADGDVYDAWPHRIEWSDGSSAGYGPEGGSGPNQLAYLEVAGQRCLYNVWSRLGVAHLEWLLGQLRFVEME